MEVKLTIPLFVAVLLPILAAVIVPTHTVLAYSLPNNGTAPDYVPGSNMTPGYVQGPDYGSEGSNGDYTCLNPNQPTGVPGCPNDQPTTTHHQQHHTADYWYGYKTGQIDRNGGQFEAIDACSDYHVHNYNHCTAGYADGFYGSPP